MGRKEKKKYDFKDPEPIKVLKEEQLQKLKSRPSSTRKRLFRKEDKKRKRRADSETEEEEANSDEWADD